ncbi:MAG: hypothetical protein HY074_15650 [Deltaproteobacteria bacterium]|nr:hypothetical protein [Deltaproteobacteria bacterium]
MKIFKLSLAAISICSFSVLGATAHAKVSQGWAVCKKDIKKFCKKGVADDQAAFQCLESHEKQLSKSCFAFNEAYEKEHEKSESSEKAGTHE